MCFLGYSLVANGAVAKVKPNATGLNPAWRNALAHILLLAGWPENVSPADLASIRNKLQQDLNALIALAPPGSGSYFNEVRVPS